MCATVRAAVIAGQCDLGLLLEAPVVTEEPAARSAARAHRARPSVVLSPDVPLVIFGGSNHPLVRRAGALQREMLASFPLLIADSAGDFHELVRRYFAAEGLPGPKLESVGSIEGVKRGVKADASALGLLPYYAVAEDLTSKEAHALTLRPPPPHMQLIALLPSSHTGSHPVVPELIEQMRTV
jgi:DNA-binding transcriptional LysR family regulator